MYQPGIYGGFSVSISCPTGERNAVDGSEIRRSPVEVGSLSPFFYKVLAPSQVVGNGISSINSMFHLFFLKD